MTRIGGVPSASAVTADEAAPTRSRAVRDRRSPFLVALGLLCACLGGLGGAWAWHQASHAESVVVMTRAVPRGEVVRSTDLAVAQVSVGQRVSTVPASRLEQLVGGHALVDLPAGSLVAADSVGELPVPPGSSQVGLKLAAGRVPGQGLTVGVKVVVVAVGGDTPTGDGTGEAGAVTSPEAVDALVASPPRRSDGGQVLVDVTVPSAQAAHVADLAARDRIALVRRGA